MTTFFQLRPCQLNFNGGRVHVRVFSGQHCDVMMYRGNLVLPEEDWEDFQRDFKRGSKGHVAITPEEEL